MDLFVYIAVLLWYGLSQSYGVLSLYFSLAVLAGLSLRLVCRIFGHPEPPFAQVVEIGGWFMLSVGALVWFLGKVGAGDWFYLLVLPVISLVYAGKLKLEFPPALAIATFQFALLTLGLLLFGGLIAVCGEVS